MYAVPSERYEVDPELAKALEIIFILHLDHEQNASTSTVRTAGQCGLCGAAWLGLAWLGLGSSAGLQLSRHAVEDAAEACRHIHRSLPLVRPSFRKPWCLTCPLLGCPPSRLPLQAPPRPTPSRAWPAALPRCGDPPTAAPTRRCSRWDHCAGPRLHLGPVT